MKIEPRPIPEIIGKTVLAAWHEHDGTDYAGPVRIEFADGTSIIVEGVWFNDSTAGTEYELA